MKLPDKDKFININSYRDEIGYYSCTAELDPKYLGDDSIIIPNEKGICSYCNCNYSQLPSEWVSVKKTGLCSGCELYKLGKIGYINIRVDIPVEEIINKVLGKEKGYYTNTTNKLVKEILRLRKSEPPVFSKWPKFPPNTYTNN